MLGKALMMIAHARPVVVVLENVKGFLSVGGGSYFTWLRTRLKSIGYVRLHYKVLSSHQFGVPQTRQRLYMVAFRDDIDAADFNFPEGDDTRTPTLSKFLKRRLAKRYSNTIRCGGRGERREFYDHRRFCHAFARSRRAVVIRFTSPKRFERPSCLGHGEASQWRLVPTVGCRLQSAHGYSQGFRHACSGDTSISTPRECDHD